ncbi:MAG: LysE family transporter [Chloroflexota bacterium]|nr:LysE family transporter [Chloroflexota bacterium]
MLEALLIGVFAGYAIAIPVGPIAVLILRTGMRDGLRAALAAGAGTATADLIYATVAMAAGPALVALIAPVLLPARLVAAALLLVLAARQLRGVDLSGAAGAPAATGRTYATVLALTLLNPATVIYFASLTVGLPTISTDLSARALFVIGAALASLSWQWLLAAVGSALHGRVPSRQAPVTGIVSSAIIAGLALKIAIDALS